MLALDERLEAGQRGALGLEALAAGGRAWRAPRRGPQAALDLGLALGQDAAALGDAGHAHLELLAPAQRPRRGAPRARARPPAPPAARAATRPSWACSAVTSARRCCAAATAARASSSSPARRRCSSAARSPSAPPASQADAWRSAARSAAARASRPRASAMRASVRCGPGQLGGGGGLLGPAPCLLDRGGGDHAGGRAHAPARGGEAVALGRDHDEVVAGEREVDGLLPAVDAHGPADERVEHRLGDRRRRGGPGRGARTGSALLPGGQRRRRAGGGRARPRRAAPGPPR